jgi:hypothetical protein
MKTKSFALGLAVVLAGCAFVPLSAEAGPKYRKNCHNGGGWYNGGYRNYAPVRYYRPVRYVPVYGYQRPTFQIGFSFGGGNGWNRGCR